MKRSEAKAATAEVWGRAAEWREERREEGEDDLVARESTKEIIAESVEPRKRRRLSDTKR